MLKGKDIAAGLLVIGIILIFLYLPAGIISIIVSLSIFLFNYIHGKISLSRNSKEHDNLARLIQDSNHAKQKVENLKELFRKESIDIRKLTSQFDTPLWSIFIFKWGEQPRYSKIIYEKKLLARIKEIGFKIIANGLYFLPPNHKNMPKISKDFDIEKWTKEQIIGKLSQDIPYTIKLICPIDLRQVFGYKTTKYGQTIFDLLLKEDKEFLKKLLSVINPKKISLGNIALTWKLGDIITIPIDPELIKTLNRKSRSILENLNCKSIINISLLDEDKIVSQIKEFTGNDSEIIAKNIKENSLSLKEVS